jgi:hypothetical protein
MASRVDLRTSRRPPAPAPRQSRGFAGRLLGGLVVAGMALGGLGLEAGALALTAHQASPSPAATGTRPGRRGRTGPARPAPPHRALPPPGRVDVGVDLTVAGGPRPQVFPATVVVPLRQAGAARVGSLPPVTVLDAQGTLRGWTLVARLTGPGTGPVVLVPAPPRALSGRPDEVRAGARRPLGAGPGVLAFAPAGGGDGRFELGGELLMPAPGQDPPRALRLLLSVRAGAPPSLPRRPPSR